MVQDNNISDLKSQLSILRQLRYLKTLYMYGNPVCEETNYRLRVIQAVPRYFQSPKYIHTWNYVRFIA